MRVGNPHHDKVTRVGNPHHDKVTRVINLRYG